MQGNLLYTAVTRAKRLVVLVGSKRALAKAVRTQGAGRRYTALTERLPSQQAARQPQHVPIEPEQRCWDQPDRTR